jgi:type VI protein secretion system component VasK
MKLEGVALSVPGSIAARLSRRIRPRRPWMLIASCLLLVVLTVTLWGKWVESRDRADRLAAELKKVYVEAEKLRTEGAAAKQRITQLERQLRGRGRVPAPVLPGPAGRTQ